MTAERIKGQLTYECDGLGCHEFYEADTNVYTDAWAAAKREGWTTHRIGERDWFHKCPMCSKSAPPDMKKLLP